MIGKMMQSIAGIDKKLLNESTNSDKIWATHIGIALTLTYIFITMIVYLSLDYLGGTTEVYDAQKEVITLTSDRTWQTTTFFVFVSLLIASMIILVDRAIFMSDWFHMTPYGMESSFMQKAGNTLKKVFRVLIRLTMAMALAFGLSVFLELRLHEGKIEGLLKQEHQEVNKHLYEKINSYESILDTEIAKKKETIKTIQGKLENSSGASLWPMDTVLSGLKDEKKNLKQEYESIKTEITQRENLNDIVKLETSLRKLSYEILKLEAKYNCELNGLELCELNGEEIETSGNEGNGTISQSINVEIKTQKKIKKLKEDELSELKAKAKASLDPMMDEKASIKTKLKAVESAIEARQNEMHTTYLNNKDKIRTELEEELDSTKIALQDLTDNKEILVQKNTDKILHSSEYTEYRDGPMIRMVALEKLYHDEKYGDEMQDFSWIIKGILIFLEVIPVLMKMFFFPASTYAIALQTQVKSKTRRIIENDGLDSMTELDEMIKMEHKRMEYLDVKEKRMFREKYAEMYEDIDPTKV